MSFSAITSPFAPTSFEYVDHYYNYWRDNVRDSFHSSKWLSTFLSYSELRELEDLQEHIVFLREPHETSKDIHYTSFLFRTKIHSYALVRYKNVSQIRGCISSYPDHSEVHGASLEFFPDRVQITSNAKGVSIESIFAKKDRRLKLKGYSISFFPPLFYKMPALKNIKADDLIPCHSFSNVRVAFPCNRTAYTYEGDPFIDSANNENLLRVVDGIISLLVLDTIEPNSDGFISVSTTTEGLCDPYSEWKIRNLSSFRSSIMYNPSHRLVKAVKKLASRYLHKDERPVEFMFITDKDSTDLDTLNLLHDAYSFVKEEGDLWE